MREQPCHQRMGPTGGSTEVMGLLVAARALEDVNGGRLRQLDSMTKQFLKYFFHFLFLARNSTSDIHLPVLKI